MKTINKFALSLIILSAAIGFTGCDSFLEEYSQDLAKVESWEDLDEVLLGNVYATPGRIYVENYNLSCFRHALPKSRVTHSETSRYSSCC